MLPAAWTVPAFPGEYRQSYFGNRQQICDVFQVTEETKQILEKEGFDFDCRGEINVKGKGLMTTYLLRTEGREVMPRRRRSSAIPAALPNGAIWLCGLASIVIQKQRQPESFYSQTGKTTTNPNKWQRHPVNTSSKPNPSHTLLSHPLSFFVYMCKFAIGKFFNWTIRVKGEDQISLVFSLYVAKANQFCLSSPPSNRSCPFQWHAGRKEWISQLDEKLIYKKPIYV